MGNRHPATASQLEPEEGGSNAGQEGRPGGGRSRLRSEGGAPQQEEGEEPEVELPPPMRPISSIPATEEVKKVWNSTYGISTENILEDILDTC